MASATLNRKLKKFPQREEDSGSGTAESEPEETLAGGSDLGYGSDSDDNSENESDSDDAPEAESLSGGRAAADARAGALQKHEEKLQALRKSKNKAREEFIQSTKPQKSPVAKDQEEGAETHGSEPESEVGVEEEVAEEIPRSSRLPDSIFTAAHESVERKRSSKPLKKDAPAKRRRVREAAAEKVVNGRTLRLMTDINAPPAISSSTSARKAKNSAKGGTAFRRKWKKVDAARAQVRSRTGPARNFVTAVQ